MVTASDVSKVLGAFLRRVCETDDLAKMNEAKKRVDEFIGKGAQNGMYIPFLGNISNVIFLYITLLATIGAHYAKEKEEKDFFADVINFVKVCDSKGVNSPEAILKAQYFIKTRNIKSLINPNNVSSVLDIIFIATQKHNGYLVAK